MEKKKERTCKKEIQNKKGKYELCAAVLPPDRHFFCKKCVRKLPRDYGFEE